MTLRQFHIIFDVVIVVLVAVVIISLVIGRDTEGSYYEDAWEAYSRAEDSAASKDASDAGELAELSGLYRKVFQEYPDSRWADDAVYRLASKIEPSEEEAILLYRRLIRDYPDSEYVDKALYSIGMGYRDKGKFVRAIAEFGELMTKYQDSDLAEASYFNIAVCRYDLEKWDQAAMEFEDFEIRYSQSNLVDDSRVYRGLIDVNRGDLVHGRQTGSDLRGRYGCNRPALRRRVQPVQ